MDTVRLDVAMAITRYKEMDTYLIIQKAEQYRSDEDEGEGRYDETPWEVPGGKVAAEDGAGRNVKHGAVPDHVAERAALRELREETGLDGTVITSADSYRVQQPDRMVVKDIVFYPVLIQVDSKSVVLADSHEHVAYKWIPPEQVETFLMHYERTAFEHLKILDRQ